ncbi:hypothetical protein F5141DRAFT_6184 [Pisolithus sp. B1]|nr:hypothetical protein F5141DRAFT_6184 [Pisolithus sp. B1]
MEPAPEKLNLTAGAASAEWDRGVIYATILTGAQMTPFLSVPTYAVYSKPLPVMVSVVSSAQAVVRALFRPVGIVTGEAVVSGVFLLSHTCCTVLIPISCPLSVTHCVRFRRPAPITSTFPVSLIQCLILGGIFDFHFFGGLRGQCSSPPPHRLSACRSSG